ncbi:hypothetical protein VX037_18665 [Gordonia sp. Z-3]|uniref:hypothetical protein n=1 Tax=Gordonia sp. Z-3 TaxID=3115408 RepID=UPI002E2B4767|nr:hypothetical protein [Gordonia sp. Z-3]MED5803051.1 hypothetical protein [Gordonia sp. Z-3]
MIARVMMVVIACVLISGCTSSLSLSSPSSSKPDIPYLTEEMILPQSEFPPLPGGTFRITAPRDLAPEDHGSGSSEVPGWCDEDEKALDQEAGSRLYGDDLNGNRIMMKIEMFHVTRSIDMQRFVTNCSDGILAAQISGLPSGAFGFTDDLTVSSASAPDFYATGYVRGILLVIGAPTQGGIVDLYNRQSNLLESWDG